MITYNYQANGRIIMKVETKRTIRNLFGSIIKNDSAIEGAKTAPWWIAVILFIVGNFLPIIPIMVNASKTYGASFIANYTYGYDQALTTCGVKLQAEGFSFNVNNGELEAKKGDEVIMNTWVEDYEFADVKPIAYYNTIIEGVSTRSLNVFYSDRPFSGSGKTIKSLVTSIEKVEYVLNTDKVYDAETDSGSSTYIPSYLILYKTGLYSKIYKVGTNKASTATYTGTDWKHTANGDLLARVLTVGDLAVDVANANYVAGVTDNWKQVFNETYTNQKWRSFWFTSGLYYGIYLVLTLFMGLMMFLLTRGKNNPNRGLNYFITTKIAAWIIFTPAVLGMILGFIWSAAAGLGFIVLIGLRTMWLSMRQLSPVAQ